MRRKSGKQSFVRLTGREFREPPEPKELKRYRTMFPDRQAAKDSAEGLAHGLDQADHDGQTYLDAQIEAEVGELAARTEYEYGKPIEAAHRVRDDAQEEQEHAQREIGELEEKQMELRSKEESFGERHGPSRVGYAALMAVSFLMLLPADVGAAKNLPLAPGLQTLVAVLLGGGMTWAAHFAGKKIEELHEAHADKDKDSFLYMQERVLLVLAIAVPVVVVIVTAVWRGQVFGADQRLTGGVAQGSAANLAFAVIGLLAFLTAVIASLGYRRMQPLREVRAELDKTEKQIKGWQLIADTAERRGRVAEVTIKWLEERLGRRVEQIEMWGERRKAWIRRKGETYALRDGADANAHTSGLAGPDPTVTHLRRKRRGVAFQSPAASPVSQPSRPAGSEGVI